MGVLNKEMEQLYLDNVPQLINFFINKNKDYVMYFDSIEDMRQTLLLKVWIALSKFEKSKGNFSTYVYIVCKNTTLNHIRTMLTNKRKVSLSSCSLDAKNCDDISLINVLEDEKIGDERTDKYLELENIVKLLNKESKLHFIDGYTYKEIAEIEDKSISIIHYIVRKNINKIKKEIQKGEMESEKG